MKRQRNVSVSTGATNHHSPSESSRRQGRFGASALSVAIALATSVGWMGSLQRAAAAPTNWLGNSPSSIGAPNSGLWSVGVNWDAPLSSGASTELDFGGTLGGALYTTTDDVAGAFTLNLLRLNSGDTGNTNVIAASGGSSLNFGGTTPMLAQWGAGAFNISAPVTFNTGITFVGTGAGAVGLTGGITFASAGDMTITQKSAAALTFGTLGTTLTNSGTSSTLIFAGSGGGAITVSSAIPANGTGGLTVSATSTVTLNSSIVNAYAGATTLNSGTLRLDFANLATPTNLINSASVLTLGGGTLAINGKSGGGNSQSFASTTLNAGGGIVTFSGGAATLNLGAITRNFGGALALPSTGTITTPTANTATSILGGWATIGGTDWAVSAGNGSTPGNITALPSGSYTTTTAANTTAASYLNKDITVDSSPAVGGIVTMNSLRFNNSTARTLTLATGINTITSGGILMTPSAGNVNQIITGGTLTSGGPDLIVSQNDTGASAQLRISSIIADNGSIAVGLTKTGAGNLRLLTAVNTFTGKIVVSGGSLTVDTETSLGAVPSGPVSDAITLNGGVLNVNGNFSITANRGIVIGPGGGTLAGLTNSMTINMPISGPGDFTAVELGPVGMTLNSATNTYVGTGNVTVGTSTQATKMVWNTIAATSTTTSAGFLPSTCVLTITSGSSVNYAGSAGINNQIVGGLSGAGTFFCGNATTATNLTINTANAGDNFVFSGVYGVGGGAGSNYSPMGLTKNGPGTQTLSGQILITSSTANWGGVVVNGGTLILSGTANDIGKGTTINNGGTLLVNSTGATGTSARTVTVNNGGILGSTANGSVIGPVSVVAGGGLGGTNGSTLTLSGTVTLAAGDYGFFNINGGASASPLINFTTAPTIPGSGTMTINLSGTPSVGTYHLLGFTTALTGPQFSYFSLTGGAQPNGFAYSLVNNAGSKYLDLSVSIGAALKTWKGTTDNIWNVNNKTNFDAGSGPVVYSESPSVDQVRFDDTASLFNVSVGATVSPVAITVANSAHDYTIGGASAIAGTAALNKSGTSALILTGANTFSGGVNVTAGALQLGADSATVSSAINSGPVGIGAVILASGTTLQDDGNVRTLANAIAINGNITLGGSAGLILGPQALNSPRSMTLANTPTLTVNVPTTIGDTIIGTGFTKAGTATLTLGGTNSYSGVTTLGSGAGTLKVTNVSGLGSSGSATLQVNGSTLELDIDSSINAYNTTIGGTATIASGKFTTGSAGITHTLGTLSMGAPQLSITVGANVTSGTAGVAFGATTLTGAAVFDTATGTSLALGALGGEFAFTKQDSGTMTLTATATRATTAGITNLSAGRLNLDIAGALNTNAAAPLNISGGTLALEVAAGATYTGTATTISNNVTIESNRLTSGAGVTQTLGTLSMGGQQLNITAGTGVTSGTAGVTFTATTLGGNPTFDTATGTNLTLGALGDGGTARTITKQNSGTLTLGAAASGLVAGTSFTVNGGVLYANAAGALSQMTSANTTTVTVNAGGELKGGIAGAFKSSGSGTPSEAISLAGGTLRLALGASTDFGGNLTYTSGTLAVDRTASGGTFTETMNALSIGSVTLAPTDPNYTAAPTLAFNATSITGNPILDSTNVIFSLGATSIASNTLTTQGTNPLSTGAVTMSGNPTFSVANTLTLGTLTDGGTARVITVTGTATGIVNLAGAGSTLSSGTKYVISAGTLRISESSNLSASPAIWDGATLSANAAALTVSQILSGTGTDGANALALTSGTLTLGDGSNFSTSFNGALSGTGNLIKAGTGTLTFNVAGTRNAGTTTLSAGTLRLNAANALNTTQQTLALNAGTLSVGLDTGATVNGTNVTVGGTATLEIDRATSGAGVTDTFGTLAIGTQQLNVTAGGNVGSGTAGATFGVTTFTGNPTFDSAANTNVTLGALGDGAVARTIIKQNSGTLTVNTAATSLIDGTQWQITGGTLSSGAAALASGTTTASTLVSVGAAGTLKGTAGNAFASAGTGNLSIPISLQGGNIVLANAAGIVTKGDVTLTASSNFTLDRTSSGGANTDTMGTLAMGGVTLSATSANYTASPTLAFGATGFSGNPTFNPNGSFAPVIQLGTLSDGGSARVITVAGTATGSVVLGGASSSLTSGTKYVISAGTLQFNDASNLSASPLIWDAGTFANNATALTVPQLLSGTGAAGAINVALSSGTLTIGDASNQSTLVSGALSGTGNLIKAGTGTLTFSAAGTRSAGTTTLSAGTLKLGNAAGLGTVGSSLVLNGGTLELALDSTVNAYPTTVGGPATIISGKATTGSAGITHTLGTLSIGAFQLNVAGGSNVSSGTAGLTFGATTLTGAPTFNITNPTAGGTTLLTLGAVTNSTFSATITGNGNFAQSGVWGAGAGGIVFDAGFTGTATLNQANTFTGGVSLTAGTLNINNATALGATASRLTIGGGILDNSTAASITESNNNPQTWNNDFVFTGTQSLNLGTGAITLSAAHTITVNANTLTAGGAISGGNGLFDITKAGNGTLALNGNAALAANQTITVNAGTLSLGGVISGGFGISKAGSATLLLTGANSYTGTTVIKAGTLATNVLVSAGFAGPVGNATSAIALGDSGTDLAATLQTTAGVTFGRDITLATGTTDRILSMTSGGSTFSGTITLNKDLQINNATNATQSFSGLITGNGGLVITGNSGGVVSITGSTNNYLGTTTVKQGQLYLTYSNTASPGSSTPAGANTIYLGDTNTTGNVSLLVKSYNDTAITIPNDVTVQSGTGTRSLDFANWNSNGSTSFGWSGTFTLDATLQVNHPWYGASFSMSGPINGAGGLIEQAANNASNTTPTMYTRAASAEFQGGTTLNRITGLTNTRYRWTYNPASLAAATVHFGTGDIAINDQAGFLFNALANAGTTNALIQEENNFTMPVGATGVLVADQTGTATPNVKFIGNVGLAGTLTIGSNSGGGGNNIQYAGTFTLDQSAPGTRQMIYTKGGAPNATLSGKITDGAGAAGNALTMRATSGTLTWSSTTSDYANGTNFIGVSGDTGIVDLTSSGALGTGAVAINQYAQVQASNASALANVSAVAVNNGGRLTANAVNTLLANVTVNNGGVLKLSQAQDTTTGATQATLNAGATVELGVNIGANYALILATGSTLKVSTFTYASNLTVSGGNGIVDTVGNNAFTLSGVVGGTGGLSLRNGPITISNAGNNYSGGTLVEAAIGSPNIVTGSVGTGSVYLQGGAKLRLSAANIASGANLFTSDTILSLPVVALGGNFSPGTSATTGLQLAASVGGVLAIDTPTFTTALDLSQIGSGKMFLGSTNGGTYGSATLSPASDNVYRLGGGYNTVAANAYLTISGGVLVDNGATQRALVVGSPTSARVLNTGSYLNFDDRTLTNAASYIKLSANNAFTGSITVNQGATLEAVVQSSGQSFGSGANLVNLIGSTLQFDGFASASRSDLAIGDLILNGGGSTLTVNTASAVSTINTLTIGSGNGLVRNANSTLKINITGTNNTLGSTTRGTNIKIANNAPANVIPAGNTAANGMVAPWITDANGNFLSYGTSNGFAPTVYTATTAAGGAQAHAIDGTTVGSVTYKLANLVSTNDIVNVTTAADSSLTGNLTVFALSTSQNITAASAVTLTITGDAATNTAGLTMNAAAIGAAGTPVNLQFGATGTAEALIFVSGSSNILNNIAAASITKSGPGTLAFRSTALLSAMPGNVVVNQGALGFGSGTGFASNGDAIFPSSTIFVLNGGGIQLSGNYANGSGSTIPFAHNVNIGQAGGWFLFGRDGATQNAVTNTFTGSITDLGGSGAGALTLFLDNSTYTFTNTGSTANTWSGGTVIVDARPDTLATKLNVNDGVNFGTGDLTLEPGNSGGNVTLELRGNSNLANTARVNVMAAQTLTFTKGTALVAGTPEIGSLEGSGSVVLGNSSGGAANLTVGRNNASTIFDGVISQASGAAASGLTKIGSGTFTLFNAQTYAGPTLVSTGTLVVNGSLATSALTVNAYATLGGSGAIGGTVTVYANGTLSPGQGVGNLTVNTLFMSGTYKWDLNATTYDHVQVNGALNVTGNPVVRVANAAGTSINPAGTYTILDYTGSLTSNAPWTVDPDHSLTAVSSTSNWAGAGTTGNWSDMTGSPVAAAVNWDQQGWNGGTVSYSGTTVQLTGMAAGAILPGFATDVVINPATTAVAVTGPLVATTIKSLTIGNAGGNAHGLVLQGTGPLTITGAVNLTSNTTLDASAASFTAGQIVSSGALTSSVSTTASSLSVNGGTTTLSGTIAIPTISVTGGTLSVNSALSGTTTFSVTAGGTANLNGGLAASALALANSGTVSFTGTSSVNIIQSTSSLQAPYAGTTAVATGSTLTANTIRQDTLHVVGTGSVTLKESAGKLADGWPSGTDGAVSVFRNLNFDFAAKLDVFNNDLIITGMTAATVESMVRNGYSNGAWDGSSASPVAGDAAFGKIVSTDAALRNIFTLLVMDSGNSVSSFDTVSNIPAHSVIVKFTHEADLNGDGVVTGTGANNDLSLFASYYAAYNVDNGTSTQRAVTHAQGDMDFDGQLTFNDAMLFANYYNEGLAHLPEPTSLAFLALGAAGLLARKRK